MRICMIAYTFYEADNRVMRYAETLAHRHDHVDVIALRKPGGKREFTLNGVHVYAIQERVRNEKSQWRYLWLILRFFLASALLVMRKHIAGRYDLVHVHSVPDFEVFAALVPKLMGARIILDIHDIVPEFYASKFKLKQDSLAVAALRLAEKLSASFADHVIVANDLWLDKIAARSARKDKCSALINYPDLSVFNPSRRTRGNDDRFILLYPGTLNWHQGVDIAVKALALARRDAPGLEFHIYGEGPAEPELRRLVNDLGLSEAVFIRSPVALREIASVMANADLGVVPKRNDFFGGEAFSTKTLEFMALGVPLVVADTRIDRLYFDESLVRFFAAGDEKDLARAIANAYKDRALSARLAARALGYARQNSWAEKSADYLKIVETLVQGRR
jgi:glycosyltransferase involved in cell wall biosynthesis